MKNLILLFTLFFSFGCANSLWIRKEIALDNGVKSGSIRYLDGEDREHAVKEAILFCAPLKPNIFREGHYQSVFSKEPFHTNETRFSYIEFICAEEKKSR